MVAFTAKVTVQRGDDADAIERRVDRWHCRNDGRTDVTVPAGTFATFVFVCRRTEKSDLPAIVRTWYYAPAVRHYVRFVETGPEPETSRTVDLVAVRPGAVNWPPIVRAALSRAVVLALETTQGEARTPWTSSGVDTRVTIEVGSRFIAKDGGRCRQFTQIWSTSDNRWHYPAVACKTTRGGWEIPGLKSNKASALATSGELS
mgnify:CR=1 FL=1